MHTGEILIFYDTHFSENIEITEVPNTKYDNKNVFFTDAHTVCSHSLYHFLRVC